MSKGPEDYAAELEADMSRSRRRVEWERNKLALQTAGLMVAGIVVFLAILFGLSMLIAANFWLGIVVSLVAVFILAFVIIRVQL